MLPFSCATSVEAPFPLTSQTLSTPNRYARIFPESDSELMNMLNESAATPLDQCLSAEEGAETIKAIGLKHQLQQ